MQPGHLDVTEAEFDSWFRRDYRSLVAALTLVCGSRSMAEEAVAEGFTKAFTRRRSVAAMSSPTAWVYRVAVNEVRMGWRRGRVERRWLNRQVTEVELPPDADPDLWAAVARLPRRQREVIALRYLLAYTQPEIADVLGISLGTVASTLHDARSALGKTLERKATTDVRSE